jgi:hypothetical protein
MKTKIWVAYVEGTGHLLHRFRKIDEISETIFSLMKRKNDRKKKSETSVLIHIFLVKVSSVDYG